jgi:ATP-dependent RNA helicase RhlE
LLESEQKMNKTLIFVKNKKVADQLFEELEFDYVGKMEVVHSNKSQKQRFHAVEQLQEGKCRFLITTNVLARGLDISDVSHVVNFDLPKEPASYVHRIGRTGRADKKGIAISFIKKDDKEKQKEIEVLMNKKITVLSLPKEVEISKELLREEIPTKRDKNLLKFKNTDTPTGAFTPKSAKNSKTPNVGKRRQENRKRKFLKSLSKRKG